MVGFGQACQDDPSAMLAIALLKPRNDVRKLATIVSSGCLLYLAATAGAQERGEAGPDVIWIGLGNGTEVEAVVASELRAAIRTLDLEPWILTRSVLIDQSQIPHSDPILTIHTRSIGDEIGLVATFLHEQLHWLEEEPWLRSFRKAMNDYEALFPEVPTAAAGGARDARSTYRHLLVCDMEYQAVTALFGQETARATLAAYAHYEWIYEKVLNDPRIREIALRHGFDVSKGVPPQ